MAVNAYSPHCPEVVGKPCLTRPDGAGLQVSYLGRLRQEDHKFEAGLVGQLSETWSWKKRGGGLGKVALGQ